MNDAKQRLFRVVTWLYERDQLIAAGTLLRWAVIHNGRVLVPEPEPSGLMFSEDAYDQIRAALKTLDMKVLEAPNGFEAVDAAPLLSQERVAVIGAGPVGALWAAYLAKRGCDVQVYEQRADMRRHDISAGRSINLVLTQRGLRALDLLGVKDQVLKLTLPVTGRMTHARDGTKRFLRYGKDDSECNYSVPRGELNKLLLTIAEKAGAKIAFEHTLQDVDCETGSCVVSHGGEQKTIQVDRIFGCDGAASATRAALVRRCGFDDSMTLIEHGYKELLFPATSDGRHALDKQALHIWARGDHMLMGLPNLDGSFTGTIYLAREGQNSFAELSDEARVMAFFKQHYAGALPYLADMPRDFLESPLGVLGTIRCYPYHQSEVALLIGDAAHGVVPFFGQGLNCGFEDCAVLAGLLEQHDTVADVFAAFTEQRKPAGDAIADMALENFIEMRDSVRDPAFVLRKGVEARIEEAFSDRYRSRYATVMYSSVPYQLAKQGGEIQREILEELTSGIGDPSEADLELAKRLIADKLTPFYQENDVSLDF